MASLWVRCTRVSKAEGIPRFKQSDVLLHFRDGGERGCCAEGEREVLEIGDPPERGYLCVGGHDGGDEDTEDDKRAVVVRRECRWSDEAEEAVGCY